MNTCRVLARPITRPVNSLALLAFVTTRKLDGGHQLPRRTAFWPTASSTLSSPQLCWDLATLCLRGEKASTRMDPRSPDRGMSVRLRLSRSNYRHATERSSFACHSDQLGGHHELRTPCPARHRIDARSRWPEGMVQGAQEHSGQMQPLHHLCHWRVVRERGYKHVGNPYPHPTSAGRSRDRHQPYLQPAASVVSARNGTAYTSWHGQSCRQPCDRLTARGEPRAADYLGGARLHVPYC